MDDAPMTIYIVQGLEDTIMLEVNPSDTLNEVKKKFTIGTGYVRDPKYVSNGKVLSNTRRLCDQGVKPGSKIYQIPKSFS